MNTSLSPFSAAPSVRLHGVHHTARPTWKLSETVRFYRDLLGLPLVHAISAKGWGPENHPDFLHFFFDSGDGSTIAFFYYIGTQRPQHLVPTDHYQDRATHTAWRVESEEELLQWRARVEAVGIALRYQIRHEVIESIYFNDPNGYPIEITWQVRPFSGEDAADAQNTLEAAMRLEEAGFTAIEPVWQAKGAALGGSPTGNAAVYVLDVLEFKPLLEIAVATPGYAVQPAGNGYVRIEGSPALTFQRKALGFKPAVWYGALTGGLAGRIERFDMDSLVIAPLEHV
ncbi:VOC family protein [Achromobacter marplatensis]|uniref:VOC family protein n=1 Tax=Achromobacter marplatensis TaxID=470868 RepID=A0AA43B3I0_9BURK|nr:VOC family protein [Achromobacter marplatensis]MDH2052729.1 VOC family protein [Achromobacter marplatensis]